MLQSGEGVSQETNKEEKTQASSKQILKVKVQVFFECQNGTVEFVIGIK